MRFLFAAIGLALLAAAPNALAQAPITIAGDAARGMRVYEERCAGCHSLDANRIGPAHRGVFGRRVGSAPDFNYSPALRASRIVWREDTLNRWLTNPQGLIPGQRMNFRLSDAGMRADVIAYLRSQSSPARRNLTPS